MAGPRSALIRELREFKIKQLRFGIRLHTRQMQQQGQGHTKFYSIAQASLQRFLFLSGSEVDFLEQETGIPSRSDERAPPETGAGSAL